MTHETFVPPISFSEQQLLDIVFLALSFGLFIGAAIAVAFYLTAHDR